MAPPHPTAEYGAHQGAAHQEASRAPPPEEEGHPVRARITADAVQGGARALRRPRSHPPGRSRRGPTQYHQRAASSRATCGLAWKHGPARRPRAPVPASA